MAEVERLADAGVREVTLIGQNVNAYHGLDSDGTTSSLGNLLRRLCRVPGILRLRYTTSHPRDMDDDLIAAHAELPALMPYVHLPVQSGSDRILAAMNRKHSRDDYLRVIERLRAGARRSRLHVRLHRGLPGETEVDFCETLSLIDDVGFAGAYSFMYSARPGTPAADMDDQVLQEEKSERLQRLQAVDHASPARLQRRLCRPRHRRAAGKARQAARTARRPLAISAGGAGHGAGNADRFGQARDRDRGRQ